MWNTIIRLVSISLALAQIIPTGNAQSRKSGYSTSPRGRFYYAVIAGDLGTVQRMHNKGVNVNTAYNDGESPLMCAVSHRHKRIVDYLLKSGANINQRDTFGYTALADAVVAQDVEFTKLLLHNGAKVDSRDRFLRRRAKITASQLPRHPTRKVEQ